MEIFASPEYRINKFKLLNTVVEEDLQTIKASVQKISKNKLTNFLHKKELADIIELINDCLLVCSNTIVLDDQLRSVYGEAILEFNSNDIDQKIERTIKLTNNGNHKGNKPKKHKGSTASLPKKMDDSVL